MVAVHLSRRFSPQGAMTIIGATEIYGQAGVLGASKETGGGLRNNPRLFQNRESYQMMCVCGGSSNYVMFRFVGEFQISASL